MKPKPSELLPCPFCGNKPNYSASCQDGQNVGSCSIYCRNCGCGLSGYENKNSILKAWNTRPKPSVKWPEKRKLNINSPYLEYDKGYNHGRMNAIDACKAAVEAAGLAYGLDEKKLYNWFVTDGYSFYKSGWRVLAHAIKLAERELITRKEKC